MLKRSFFNFTPDSTHKVFETLFPFKGTSTGGGGMIAPQAGKWQVVRSLVGMRRVSMHHGVSLICPPYPQSPCPRLSNRRLILRLKHKIVFVFQKIILVWTPVHPPYVNVCPWYLNVKTEMCVGAEWHYLCVRMCTYVCMFVCVEGPSGHRAVIWSPRCQCGTRAPFSCCCPSLRWLSRSSKWLSKLPACCLHRTQRPS